MLKEPGSRNLLHILGLVLIAVSLACNAPGVAEMVEEAVVEDCKVVTRETYEAAAADLGQTPETPKDPEMAVYEVCYLDLKLVSVRMSERAKPEVAEKKEAQSIPAGNYYGETDFYLILEMDIDDSYLAPVCLENNISVAIYSDGTVFGEIEVTCTANSADQNPEMITTHHAEITGLIRGECLGCRGAFD